MTPMVTIFGSVSFLAQHDRRKPSATDTPPPTATCSSAACTTAYRPATLRREHRFPTAEITTATKRQQLDRLRLSA